ncbi:MAG: hypothetical protein GY822_08420 [Deltaproteobacteria bacterium]|nr:hypothetical protein [Deltaproteobacteria bacterium]
MENTTSTAMLFGVTRVTLPKKLKLKTTYEATAARGISLSASGKFLLVNGRKQTGVYGDDALVLLRLPSLAIAESW